jgi:hypothetical protein
VVSQKKLIIDFIIEEPTMDCGGNGLWQILCNGESIEAIFMVSIKDQAVKCCDFHGVYSTYVHCTVERGIHYGRFLW